MYQGGRLSELQQFAARSNARQVVRGAALRQLAEHLTSDETIEAVLASRPATAATVVLVTSEHVLIARQATPDGPVGVEALARPITEVAVLPNGAVAIRATGGSAELDPFGSGDVAVLARLARPPRTRSTRVKRQPGVGRGRRPLTDLDLLATLREAGVLTDVEHETLRGRLLARVAAHGG